MSELSKKLAKDSQNNDIVKEINKWQTIFNTICISDARGAQIRSKAIWAEEGEKSTKYFLNLEKVKAQKKIMTSCKSLTGQVYHTQDEIMREQVLFYENRYKQSLQYDPEKLNKFVEGIQLPQLTEQERTGCEGKLTEDECAKALKTLRNDSSPGIDGLSGAFLKVFWVKIKHVMLSSFNKAYDTGKLSWSQRQAVISLLYKGKGLPKDELKNWRPISLLNSDYKVVAKALALRLKGVIKSIVSEDQCGYVNGRFAGMALRLVDDIIEYTNKNDIEGIMLTVDFSAAYDSISKDFLIDSFTKFGFGNSFINWIKVLNSDVKSSINNNGWISEQFTLERGIRQGCNFSPMCFIVACEILACKIRQSKNVQGVTINNKEIKISQYADDTTNFIKGPQSLKNLLSLYDDFYQISGLAVNKLKTEAIWLGRNRLSQEKYCNLKWKLFPNNVISLLGITFSTIKHVYELDPNVQAKFNKCECIMKSWQSRNLTLLGKITLIKTLLTSQFGYLMQSFVLPEKLLDRINTLMFKYLWSKSKYKEEELKRVPEKVKRNVIIQDYKKGGLKMIEIHDVQKAYLVKWVKTLVTPGNGAFRIIPQMYFDKFGPDMTVFNSTVKKGEMEGLDMLKSCFYKTLLTTWLDINWERVKENDNLFNNTNVRFRNQPIFFKKWVKAGFIFLKDIVVNDNLVSYDNICSKLERNGETWFQYRTIKCKL